MKRNVKQFSLVALMLGAIPLGAYAEPPMPPAPPMGLQMYVPNLDGGYEFNASILFLKPTNRYFDYAVLTHPLPALGPTWNVQTVDPTENPGFNVGVRYIAPGTGRDVQLNWTHEHTSDSAGATAGPGAFIGTFFNTGPLAVDTSIANATGTTHYDVVNFDAGQFVQFGNHLQTRLFAGLTGLALKEELVATLSGIVVNTTAYYTLTTNNISRYTGMGTRFGSRVSYDVYPCISIIGQMAGSVLVGTEKSNATYTTISPVVAAGGLPHDNQFVQADKSTQVVPALDAKLGLSYSYMFRNQSRFTFEIGYQAETYINAITIYQDTCDVAGTPLGSGVFVLTMGRTVSDFTNHGPYLNFSYKI